MSSQVIKVENLSKQYRLGQVGTGSLSEDINRLWHHVRGKEDPYLRVGEENNRESKGNSRYIWALRDINFEIERGDRVGIIGGNGAGKSTLLKILSRTLSPTAGSVRIKGKVASLLEVGTGFHPDLSGRDNIFLNGAFLGMSKRDIKSRFDEIIEFAGVARYIDTPVKRYSSGMYVRLAFAVAAHLESDILIVDEVLAVGDAEFQKKCLGKMGEVSKSEGRTVLFVSHNMNAIMNLCNNSFLLQNGRLINHGITQQIVSIYSNSSVGKLFIRDFDKTKKIQLIAAEVVDTNSTTSVDIKLSIFSVINQVCSIDVRVNDNLNNPFGFASLGGINPDEKVTILKGKNQLNLRLFTSDFALGIYSIHIDITNPNIEYFDRNQDCLQFEVIKNSQGLNKSYMAQSWNYGSYNIPMSFLSENAC